jgi:hypothetical protein
MKRKVEMSERRAKSMRGIPLILFNHLHAKSNTNTSPLTYRYILNTNSYLATKLSRKKAADK